MAITNVLSTKHCLKSFVSVLSYCTARCVHLSEHFHRGSVSEIELQTPVSLAGRKYLASSDSTGFPQTLSGPRENFPLLVKARNAGESKMKHWAMRSRHIVDQALQEYSKNGSAVAILFRGLPNNNERDFAEWVNNLGFEPFPYVGGTTSRPEIERNVSEGAADDKLMTMELHNDLAYLVKYPKIFAISCFKKSSWGGETAICDTREFYTKLDAGFVEKCAAKDIRYWHCLPSKTSEKCIYNSWEMSFATEDMSQVEQYLTERGYNYTWDKNALFYWNNLPATRTHAISGEQIWFNQITSHHCSYFFHSPSYENVTYLANTEYPFHTTYGDGEEIDPLHIDEHRRCNWESAVGFDWQNGDILLLDNLLVQHSRLSFRGGRKVGLSLLDYSV